MLNQARLKKQQQGQSIPEAFPIKSVQLPPKPNQLPPNSVIPSNVQSNKVTVNHADDSLPFDDEHYAHLKFVIEKLTAKIKNDISLTPDEMIKFKKSVYAIIKDAGVSLSLPLSVPQNPSNVAPNGIKTKPVNFNSAKRPVEALPSVEKDAFSSLRGLKSTWEVKDAEKMSTEEYYNEVNRRNAEIRAKRKAIGEDGSTETYIRDLNNANRK
jgi:hypothetical protein